jgi:hypothetical protein
MSRKPLDSVTGRRQVRARGTGIGHVDRPVKYHDAGPEIPRVSHDADREGRHGRNVYHRFLRS